MANVMFSCGGNKAKAEKATRDIRAALKRGEIIFPEVLTEIEANKDILSANKETIKDVVRELNSGGSLLNNAAHKSSFMAMGSSSVFYDAISCFQQGVKMLSKVHGKIGDDIRAILCPSALDPILKGWDKILNATVIKKNTENTIVIKKNTDEDLYVKILESLGKDELVYFQTLGEKIKKIVETLCETAGLEKNS